MTSPRAQKMNRRPTPIPVPTLPASQLVNASPVRPEQLLAFEEIAVMTQISMIRLKARMTQEKKRQWGKRRRRALAELDTGEGDRQFGWPPGGRFC
jgi:hypothetical protein